MNIEYIKTLIIGALLGLLITLSFWVGKFYSDGKAYKEKYELLFAEDNYATGFNKHELPMLDFHNGRCVLIGTDKQTSAFKINGDKITIYDLSNSQMKDVLRLLILHLFRYEKFA